MTVLALSPSDEKILRAALLDGDAAVSAFESWRAETEWASITPDITKMLPLVHHNLTRQGYDHPIVGRMKGVRRYYWVGNLKRMKLTRRAFAALADAGIPTIVQKGVSVIICFLHDRSLRAMDDIDVLVPYDRLGDAAQALSKVGIRPMFTNILHLTEHIRRRSTLSGWPFIGGKDEDIDVHWHAMHHDRQNNTDDDIWAASEQTTLEGVPVRVMDPADQIVHACTHAAQIGSNRSLRWVADAAIIVRGAGSRLSWQRVIEQSAKRRVSAIMADALQTLDRVVEAGVPRSAIHALIAGSTVGERIEQRLRQSPGAVQTGWLARQYFDFEDYRRGPNGFATTPAARALPLFIKEKCDVGSLPLAGAAMLYQGSGRASLIRRLLGLGQRDSVPDWTKLPSVSEPVTFTECTATEWAFVSGWAFPESTGRWTVGREARLAWRLSGRTGNLECSFEAMPGVHGVLHRNISVELWANSTKIGAWRFDQRSLPSITRSVAIPATALAGYDLLVLSFLVRNPLTPAAYGLSADTRPLGLHIKSLTLFSPESSP